MFYSWYLSYPLSINFIGDFVFNHVDVLYWFSLSLLFPSMFMIAATSKNAYLKWLMTVGIVMTLYSITYFYALVPTSDSNYYRGLNEYFQMTKNLDFSISGKTYFQWPGFFLLTNIATSVSGLELTSFEFIMYGILGFLLTTALYVYVSQYTKNGAFIAVIAFFIVNYYYLNYQFAAFTIAFFLLILLFILDSRPKSFGVTLTMLFLFTCMVMTHQYVPIFFMIYLLIKGIFNRNRHYFNLLFLTLFVYVVYTFYLAIWSFAHSINNFLTQPSGLSGVAGVASFTPSIVPIDAVAQRFSTALLVIDVSICAIGFFLLLIRRKVRDQDKAVGLMGVSWIALGSIFYALGNRAISIAFIPFSLGAAYLFESKLKKYVIATFLVLLVFLTFIPLHAAFYTGNVLFQTGEGYVSENFFIDHYNWNSYKLVVSDYWVNTYFSSRITGNAQFSDDVQKIGAANAIFYTIGLGQNLRNTNYTVNNIIQGENFDVVYDSGYSIGFIKGNS